jgi:Ni,Fe-hydrogenase III large subunit
MMSFTPASSEGDDQTVHVDPDYVVAVVEKIEGGRLVAGLHLAGGLSFDVKDPSRAATWRIKQWKENV